MRKIVYLFLCLVLLSSCSLNSETPKPEIAIPDNWRALSQTDPVVIAKDWWKSFNSKELNGLIEQALENNTELNSGIYKVEQARAVLKKTNADLLPSVDSSIGATASMSNPTNGGSNGSRNYSAGISIAYEVDLFGSNKAQSDMAKKNIEIREYELESLKLVVMADVASNYFTLINLRERLAIADTHLNNVKKIKDIIKSRRDEGLDSDIEVAEQKSAVASAKSSRASILEQIKNTENALSVLVGEVPAKITTNVKSLSDISIPEIKPDMPSRILEQRPDMRIAESNLYIADANIAVARAALFPSFSLTSSWSIATKSFTNPSSTALSLVSAVSVPLFKGWSLEAGVEQATAEQKELAENYKQTVLEALQEVEDSLIAVKTDRKKEKYSRISLQNTNKIYDLNNKKYESGAIDYQTLLSHHNSKLSAEDSYLQSRLDYIKSIVTLYKALGGGWSN